MSSGGMLIIAVIAVVLAVALAWIPARVLVFAIAKSAASHVRQWVKRTKDRRKVPRGTPDRRKSWNPEAAGEQDGNETREADEPSTKTTTPR